MKKLQFIQTIKGNHFQQEQEIIKIIESWSGKLILIGENNIKITNINGEIEYEGETAEIENDFLSQTFTCSIFGKKIRIVLAGGIAKQILSARGEPEPLSIASLKTDGFSVQFELIED